MERSNMTVTEGVQILLAGRAGAYRILQTLLGNEPDDEILDRLGSEASNRIFELFLIDEASAYRVALSDLQSMVKAALGEGDASIERIKSNFTRLFVGPGKVEVPPWESIYRSKEDVLFQGNTLAVRKAYVAQGFIPQRYPHVADDHVALELDFMAQLAAKLERAFMAHDVDVASSCINASDTFIREHLIGWIPDFSKALVKAPHSFFYKEVGSLLAAFLSVDLRALQELQDRLKPPV
jgi:TorA maturation chaperone TorD